MQQHAARIVEHKCMEGLCVAAAKQGVTFKAWLQRQFHGCGVEDRRQAIVEFLELISLRDGLSPAVREDLSKRARTVFDCHYRRAAGTGHQDRAQLEAIELALIDLYPKRLAATIAKHDGGTS